MFNYRETYSGMDDDELLRLASQWHTLTEAAQAALGAELERRKLKGEFETVGDVHERRTHRENAPRGQDFLREWLDVDAQDATDGLFDRPERKLKRMATLWIVLLLAVLLVAGIGFLIEWLFP